MMCFDKVLEEPNKKDSLESAKYDIKNFSIYIYILKKNGTFCVLLWQCCRYCGGGLVVINLSLDPVSCPGQCAPVDEQDDE